MQFALLLELLVHAGGGANISRPAGTLQSAATFFSVAAQSAVTQTATAQNTPVPLSTVTPPAELKLNFLDLAFLGSVPTPAVGPFAWGFLALMIAIFAVGAYFYFFKRPEWKRTNPVLRRAADRWAAPAMWLSFAGILLVGFRIISLDFFNLRFWLYLWLLVMLGMAGWFLFWYRTRYPKEVAKYMKTQRARQYMPSAAKRGQARNAPSAGRAAAHTQPAQVAGVGTGAARTSAPTAASGSGSASAGGAQLDRRRRRRR